MPLAGGTCVSADARRQLQSFDLNASLPKARSPQGALSGLWMYFSCLDEAHTIAQDMSTTEGSFWHGIMHRQEPDPGNAGYWFRRVGQHPIFPALQSAAHDLGYDTGPRWDPYRFIDFCEEARQSPGSADEQLALQVQRAEWQLLFDYCASPAAQAEAKR